MPPSNVIPKPLTLDEKKKPGTKSIFLHPFDPKVEIWIVQRSFGISGFLFLPGMEVWIKGFQQEGLITERTTRIFYEQRFIYPKG